MMPRPINPDAIHNVKAAVRQRDGHCCTSCGMTNEAHVALTGKGLEVHRIVPGSVYVAAACRTLCQACHKSQPKRPRGSVDLARPNVRRVEFQAPVGWSAVLDAAAAVQGLCRSEYVRMACILQMRAAARTEEPR